jgi:Ca2+/H+ antiporter, TMEM165/GDT1 family
LEALFVSTGVVAPAESAKTQLLARLLATRLHAPVPVVLGIVVATLAHHAFAGALGTTLGMLIANVPVVFAATR